MISAEDVAYDKLKKIDGNSKVVEQYAEQRMKWYGVDGCVPAEFFPTYQHLRRRDGSRFYLQVGSVVCLVKKVRIFKAQFNRLEGLPLSLTENFKEARLVSDFLFAENWVGKVRVCEKEYTGLEWEYPSVSCKPEGTIANFWIDVKSKFAHVSRSSWRGRSVLNYANKNGCLEWRQAQTTDLDDLHALYKAWVRYKQEEKQTVMYKELYTGILSSIASGGRSGLLNYVLCYQGKVIAFVSYLISGSTAHLLANQSICMTDMDISGIEKVAYYAGKLSFYFTMKTFKEMGVDKAFLGYGDDPKDPLNEYKRAHSDGQTSLFIVETGNEWSEPRKEEQKPNGLFQSR